MMVLEEPSRNCTTISINDYGYVLYNILRAKAKCFLKLSLPRNYCYCFKTYYCSMKTNSCIVEFKLSIWYSSSRSDSCIGREERDKRNRLPVVPYQIYFKGKKMKVIAPRRG